MSRVNLSESKNTMDEFLTVSTNLSADLSSFVQQRSSENENFRFLVQFLVKIVHDPLRADREGLCNLHLDSVERAMHQFAGFDSTNYLRWGAVYLKDMRNLSETIRKEANIKAVMPFILEKGCPFSDECPPTLHNFITKQVMSDAIMKDMHYVLKVREVRYEELEIYTPGGKNFQNS